MSSLKAKVPLYNTTLDPVDDPGGAAMTFIGMVAGAAALIGAVSLAREGLHWGANQTSAAEEDQLRVI